MPGDNTLGQYLGSMADAWGQAYDPLARARAAQMGVQMQTSAFDLQKARAIDAANANAATVYQNANPLNEDPASLAATAAAIRSGTYNPEQWVNATTGLAKLNANKTTAGTIDASSPEFQGWSPADIASAKAQALAGAPLATVRSQQATAALDTAKTNALITAANAAKTPITPATDTTPGTDPAGDALIRAGILAGQTAPDIMRARAMEGIGTSPTGTDQANLNQRSNLITVATGQPPSLQTPLVPEQAPAIVQRNTVADAIKESAIRATTPGRPGDVFRPFGQTPAGGFQVGGRIVIAGPGEKVGDVVATPSVQPTPAGQPAQPPVTTTDASGNTVVSPSIAGQTKFSEMQAEQYGKDLTEAREGGAAGDKLVATLTVAKQLHDQLASSSPADQAWNQILQKIAQATGVAVNDRASALQAIGNMVAQQMPDMREDLHIRNFAGPEIAAIKTMLADPALSSDVFNLIINTEMSNANVARNRRDAALDAIRGSQAPTAYYDKERQVLDPANNPMWQYFKDNPGALGGNISPFDPKRPMGAAGKPPPPPAAPQASQTQPTIRVNPTTGDIERLGPGGKWNKM